LIEKKEFTIEHQEVGREGGRDLIGRENESPLREQEPLCEGRKFSPPEKGRGRQAKTMMI